MRGGVARKTLGGLCGTVIRRPRRRRGTFSTPNKRQRQPAPVHCAYVVGAVEDDSSSDSSGSDSESGDGPELVLITLADACQAAGISPLQRVDLDLDPATIAHCAKLRLSNWDGGSGLRYGLPQKVQLKAPANRYDAA